MPRRSTACVSIRAMPLATWVPPSPGKCLSSRKTSMSFCGKNSAMRPIFWHLIFYSGRDAAGEMLALLPKDLTDDDQLRIYKTHHRKKRAGHLRPHQEQQKRETTEMYLFHIGWPKSSHLLFPALRADPGRPRVLHDVHSAQQRTDRCTS